jgi:hypothetical protein
MAGTTTKGLRYPTAGDNPAVHTDIKNLADDVDAELSDYVLTSTANSTYASAATSASLDSVRVVSFMLGGM